MALANGLLPSLSIKTSRVRLELSVSIFRTSALFSIEAACKNCNPVVVANSDICTSIDMYLHVFEMIQKSKDGCPSAAILGIDMGALIGGKKINEAQFDFFLSPTR
jgi:hypothetical protein